MACDCKKNGEFDLKALEEILAKYQGVKGSLIPVLQQAQNAYGYLPKAIIEEISKALKIPTAEVFGVVTFYAQFHLQPRGKNIIRACQGTACHVRGAKAILEAISEHLNIKPGQTTEDLNFTLETVACIGACGLAPVIMINNDTHGRLTATDIPGIIDSYLA